MDLQLASVWLLSSSVCACMILVKSATQTLRKPHLSLRNYRLDNRSPKFPFSLPGPLTGSLVGLLPSLLASNTRRRKLAEVSNAPRPEPNT